MSELHLRPRTVSELVDAAFTLYRRHAMQYIVASAIATTPVLVVELLLPQPDLSGASAAAGTVFMFNGFISWLGLSLVSAVVVRLGSDAYLGREPDVAAAVREVAPRAPRIILATVLKLPLYVLGFLGLMVGALYVFARWFAVAIVVVLEDRGVLASFRRSTELSRGRKGHILITLGLVWIIYTVLGFGLGAAMIPFENQALALIIGAVLEIVAYPVVALTGMVLYYDARIRGEGFDLEQMASALDAPAVTAP